MSRRGIGARESALIEWFTSEAVGGQLHRAVEFAVFDEGRGLRVSEAVDKGTVLFSMDIHEATMGWDMRKRMQRVARHLREDPQATDEMVKLADELEEEVSGHGWMPVLMELAEEMHLGENSRWAPYLDVLPTEYGQLDSVMFWNAGEQDWLRCISPALVDATDYEAIFENRFLRYAEACSVQGLEEFTLKQFLALTGVVKAYSFTLGSDLVEEDDDDEHHEGANDEPVGVVLVPMADMMNANHMLQNVMLEMVGGTVQVVAKNPLEKNEQLWNSYGDLPNFELLSKYGYVLADNDMELMLITHRDWHQEMRSWSYKEAYIAMRGWMLQMEIKNEKEELERGIDLWLGEQGYETLEDTGMSVLELSRHVLGDGMIAQVQMMMLSGTGHVIADWSRMELLDAMGQMLDESEDEAFPFPAFEHQLMHDVWGCHVGVLAMYDRWLDLAEHATQELAKLRKGLWTGDETTRRRWEKALVMRSQAPEYVANSDLGAPLLDLANTNDVLTYGEKARVQRIPDGQSHVEVDEGEYDPLFDPLDDLDFDDEDYDDMLDYEEEDEDEDSEGEDEDEDDGVPLLIALQDEEEPTEQFSNPDGVDVEGQE